MHAVLTDLLGRLPAPFSMVDIESRIKTRTPFVVLALQVRMAGRSRSLCKKRRLLVPACAAPPRQ